MIKEGVGLSGGCREERGAMGGCPVGASTGRAWQIASAIRSVGVHLIPDSPWRATATTRLPRGEEHGKGSNEPPD